MARGQSPGEGWAWFGDPKGKGRWSIDTASDVWSDQQKGWFSNIDKQKTNKGPTLPGWFQGSYNPETGKAYGMNYSGGMGWLSQGGDLTAEHYGQPGSWSFTEHLRPDGSGRHTVGDLYWKGDWGKATKQEGPDFYSKDPNYQTKLAEQKARMRDKMVSDIQAGKGSVADLYRWDKQYGQEDLAGGKHGTERFSEQDTATKQAQLAQQQEGVVKVNTAERANKGLTLAQRLRSLGINALTSISSKAPFGAAGYGSGIAASAFSGEQVNRTARKGDMNDYLKNNLLGTEHFPSPIQDQGMSGYQTPSDDWFYKGKDGTYIPHTAETRAQFPNNAVDANFGPMKKFLGKQLRQGNEIVSRGKSVAQITRESPFHDPVFHIDDPAYFNMNQTKEEMLVEADKQAWRIGKGLQKIGGTQYSNRNKPAPLEGRPTPEILGMDALSGSLPYAEWSPEVKRLYEQQQNYRNPGFRFDFNQSMQAGEYLNPLGKARGSTYNPNINRNVLTIRN